MVRKLNIQSKKMKKKSLDNIFYIRNVDTHILQRVQFL